MPGLTLTSLALKGLKSIFTPAISYKNACILLMDLRDDVTVRPDMLPTARDKIKLMPVTNNVRDPQPTARCGDECRAGRTELELIEQSMW